MHRLPVVYTAAFAASGDRSIAEQVAERVMLAAGGGDATSLAERAVLLALRAAPHRAFAPMGAGEREAVALARLTGATTGRVAAVLGISQDEARARMRSGLRKLVGLDPPIPAAPSDPRSIGGSGLSGGGGPRTPQLRRGSGSATSPGRGGRAS